MTQNIFHAVNPATGERLEPPYRATSVAEAEQAARRAGEAFAVYRKTSGAERAAFLRAIAKNLESAAEPIVERMRLETALPEGRCRGELARTCGQLRLFADLVEEGSWVDARIDHGDPSRQPLPKPDTRYLLQALGPVAVFGPANFPLAFAVAGGDTASALAAGCPVVVKAHSSHPGTSELAGRAIVRAAETCGLPEGVFALLFGSGKALGPALVGHPAIKAVGFTGSKQAGRALFDLAAARPEPIPVFAEMGSLNPVFVFPRALAERGGEIAAGLHASVTLGHGQFCTKPGLVVLEEGPAADRLAADFGNRMAETAPGVLLNSGTLNAYREGMERLRANGEITALAPAHADDANAESRAVAALFKTSAAGFQKEAALREEIFGPATLLVTASSREELFRFAHGLEGCLTATLHGTDDDFAQYRELIDLLETKAGRLVFNGYPTGVEVCASMNHSGPYPASSDARFTSVGTAAILRFVRPVCYQNSPQAVLPPELRDGNPLGIHRREDNENR